MNVRRLPLPRLLAGALVLAALGSIFAWYLDPQLVFELANRAWSCL